MGRFDGITKLNVAIAEHVATVTMAAPPVNAQDRRFREELIQVFDVLGQLEDVRAIVLTGEGRMFSAGADLKSRAGIDDEPGGYSDHNRLVRAAFDVVADCPKPVIAALNGPAIGGGCGLALSCDILIVAEEAWVSFSEVEFGLAGGARHAMRWFSPSDARMLIYTARRVSGADLYRMNAASLCVPLAELMDTALGMAREISAKAPLAVEAAKRAFILTEDMPLREGYRFEQAQTALLAATSDTREALAAFAEKRKPIFRKR